MYFDGLMQNLFLVVFLVDANQNENVVLKFIITLIIRVYLVINHKVAFSNCLKFKCLKTITFTKISFNLQRNNRKSTR